MLLKGIRKIHILFKARLKRQFHALEEHKIIIQKAFEGSHSEQILVGKISSILAGVN
jgi:hypothetical protein